MQSEKLIQPLTEEVQQILKKAEKLRQENLGILTWREHPISWSILECLEHLNRYGDFYLPELRSKISNAPSQPDPEFKSSVLGNYFAKSMLPKGKLNKMKTFKSKNPLNAKLDKNVIDRFISQQTEILDLLNQARKVSLNKVKIQTSISSLIRLNLGDTFRFYIYHIIRHFKQINRIEEAMKNANPI